MFTNPLSNAVLQLELTLGSLRSLREAEAAATDGAELAELAEHIRWFENQEVGDRMYLERLRILPIASEGRVRGPV